MSSVDQKIVPLVSPDGRLKLEFHWSIDRFFHRILLDQVEVARSIEGDSNDLWPDSPPMQQLSLEPIRGSDAILGVGLAGRTHWSLSVELDQCESQSPGFRFEWAARCREVPTQLGSAYLAADSILISACDSPSSRELRAGAAELADSKTNAFPDGVPSDRDGWRELVIGPEAGAEEGLKSSAASTFRWSYRVSFEL